MGERLSPRINLEDQLFREQGWLELVIELKDPDKALGALIRAWYVAQGYWKDSDNGIPKTEWKRKKLNDAIIGKLADDRGDFIYMHGSAEQFGWLRDASEAGRKGGLKSQENRRSDPEQPLRVEKPFEPSSSPSLSPSSSSSPSSSDFNLSAGSAPRPPAKPKKPKPVVETAETWKAYQEAYSAKYREDPVRNKTTNSQMKKFVERVGVTEAPGVAKFYLTHNDSLYVKALHSVGLLLRDAEALRTQWARGRAITGTDARSVERAQTNSNAFSAFSALDGRANGNV